MAGMTVQDVVNRLWDGVQRSGNTVDRLETGDPGMAVTGIATAFMPSKAVIEQAIAQGVNLLIAHEGVYFSHHGDTSSFEGDPVFEHKRKRIQEAGLAIYRCHDYVHRMNPDLITAGLVQQLGWEHDVVRVKPEASVVELPGEGVTLSQIAGHVKRQLGAAYIRALGDASMPCRRIGLLVGYRGGGQTAIPLYREEKLDLLIYGEGPEWETPVYIADAIRQGHAAAVLAIGHAESEQAGMALLADRIRSYAQDVPVYHLTEPPIFHIL
ncbi:Nif3-like dinuclear metal center hexameric protein [Paenibacillus protaetiae]|uniref:GTP cyclohydrolase 1 type 2 homolog n=1 Tax=Paenibacillus protaetiae TaxID=2509456 RepID=A0A4P6EVE5_9BACL|nr:Nif3-like dinuclear metal center hexameric protein [Paenibacillus protaetiae]QAY66495.1 transcriptional regulator [Paenibacillus protaetiae]